MSTHHYAVIMAGGVGSRFWPLSRTAKPKQFLDLLGIGKSLLQITYARLRLLFPPDRILVVTTEVYADLVRQHLPELTDAELLLEPTGRNTAPCIAYATQKLLKLDPEARLLVAAADHLIVEENLFLEDVKLALATVDREPCIVTLGIHPTRPDTGYGYIQHYDKPDASGRLFKVKTFTEKPSLEIAEKFLESGDFLWNSGMFIFAAATLQAALHRHDPDLYDEFQQLAPYLDTPDEGTRLAEAYARCRNISIDVSVMEKADNVHVIRAEFGWSDLGTWRSLYEQMPKDNAENVALGDALLYDSRGNLVFADKGHLVVLKDMQNTIVVAVGDATLVINRDQEQFVKEIVGDLRIAGRQNFL